MAHKSVKFLTAALSSTALVLSPIAAQAGGMGHFGMGGVPNVPKLQCPEGVPSGHPVMNRSLTINKTNTFNNTLNVYKPVTVTNNINNSKNIEINKEISVYKPITITNNIENNKNIEINKNINNSKNIEINKNVNINKNININKNVIINKGSSSSESEALAIALAEAVAAAAASSSSATATGGNVTISLNNSSNSSANNSGSNSATSNSNSSSNSSAAAIAQANFLNSASLTANATSSSFSSAAAYNNSSFFSNFNVSSVIPETPGFVSSNEINVNVSPAEVVSAVAANAAGAACTFQEATVIKAIHAICVSEDHHEFPASHMVGDTWINAGYEGEIARCLPGSALKVTVGSVIQSSQGAAVNNARGETLICAPHEALRHFKNGVLKCALAAPVPDCTERTNLRKFGTGDMFFSYVTQVCLETGRELVGGESREVISSQSYGYRQSALRGAASSY